MLLFYDRKHIFDNEIISLFGVIMVIFSMFESLRFETECVNSLENQKK